MITKKKRIEELERNFEKKCKEYDSLRHDYINAVAKLECIESEIDKTPEGCTLNRHCHICAYSKTFRVPDEHGYINTIYLCDYAKLCDNFVLKPECREENKNVNQN